MRARKRMQSIWILGLLAGLVPACGPEGDGPCPSGQERCDGVCVYISTSRDHCGECGHACLPGQYCAAGRCVPCHNECVSGQRQCVPGNPSQYQECGSGEDTCMSWGPAQVCSQGTVCSEGDCVQACEDDCLRKDARVCDPQGANGYRICGYYDTDDCLEWSELVPCPDGSGCTDGQCSAGCRDECAAGERRCSVTANGYETCADHDADGCLEYGGFVACEDGQTCSRGACSGSCQDDCDPGERMCEGAGYRSCGYYDADDCLDWSDVVACGGGQACNPSTGQCEAACADECSPGEQRCSRDGAAVELCADWDGDGCQEWGSVMDCLTGQRCQNNVCVWDCQDECEREGSRACTVQGSEVGVVTCGDHDADPCLEFGMFSACEIGQSCSNGVCSTDCQDECDPGERECQGGGYRTCGQYDLDSCRDWSDVTGCAPWQVCSGGYCQDNCSALDECGPEGSTTCTADMQGVRTCIPDYDEDPCLEWGPVYDCPGSQVCEGGRCTASCQNECFTLDAHQCTIDGLGYEVCRDHDSDGCLEWGGYTDCPGTQTCSNGVCSDTCQNECDYAYQLVCDGTEGYRICNDYDSDPCLELGSFTDCGHGYECRAGEGCQQVCSDECSRSGDLRCNGDAVESCQSDHDADECLEWGTQLSCSTGQTCYDETCVPVDPPAELVISELLYDDASTDGEYVFIEIHGPAGLSLDYFSLVGVNGANGDDYVTISLDGMTLPTATGGHFVVADTNSEIDPAAIQLVHSGADLQNGPSDAVQIRWRGEVVVDAVAYDPGSGTPHGEGEPAEGAAYDNTNGVMYCLARSWSNDAAAYRDTDDNYADFWKRSYCSPGWPGYGERYASYDTYSSVDSTPAIDIVTGDLYVTSDDFIDAVDSNLNYRWFAGPDGPKSSPALSPDGSRVYFGLVASGSDPGGLYAYDSDPAVTSDPDPIWIAVSGTDVRSSPAVGADGTIYVGTRGQGLVAIEPSGGSVRWTVPESSWVDSSPALAPVGPGGAEIAVYGVGGYAGDVVAVRTSNGQVAWRTTSAVDGVSPGGGCNASPAIGSDGTVYAACDDGYLYALDGASGAAVWPAPLAISTQAGGGAGQVQGRSPAVVPGEDGDMVFVTSAGSDLNFLIVDSTSGMPYSGWSFHYGQALSSVTVLGDGGFALVWGDEGSGTQVLDVWGPYRFEWYEELGGFDAGAWIVGSPNAEMPGSTGLLYAATHDGELHAYFAPAGLWDGAGAFPKFRAAEANRGRRY
ncbi:MAG: PQQ-binding-like beta-propeller repeat protein [Deltaproteobacteria bacterium]|nr:PQQ-binding-like beta-propeller repeat protein [Deltaproteobacteria bacterium]